MLLIPISLITAAVQGGAIYLAKDGSVDVDKSKFIDNSANVGGASASYGSGNLNNCNFTNKLCRKLWRCCLLGI